MVGNGASVLPTVRDKSQIEIAITWASSSYDLSGTRARRFALLRPRCGHVCSLVSGAAGGFKPGVPPDV